MKPEIKQLWIDAMKSGEFHKTEARLFRIKDGVPCHCALGVLCELALRAGVPLTFNPVDLDLRFYLGPEETEEDGRGTILPNEVVTWSGLDHYKSADVYIKNDAYSEDTFEPVVAWLERNPEI